MLQTKQGMVNFRGTMTKMGRTQTQLKEKRQMLIYSQILRKKWDLLDFPIFIHILYLLKMISPRNVEVLMRSMASTNGWNKFSGN